MTVSVIFSGGERGKIGGRLFHLPPLYRGGDIPDMLGYGVKLDLPPPIYGGRFRLLKTESGDRGGEIA